MIRSTTIAVVLAALLAFAPSALADSGSGETSTTETPSTEVVTETPATTEVVTETPVTTTDVPVTTTETETPVTGTPITTETGTTVPEVDTCAGCIPADVDTCADCIPSAGGGIPTAVGGAGSLPFTGIEDTIAPLLLALTVVLGGVVAWRWAQLRESVAIDAGRARPVPAKDARSGYAAALRSHLIEERARRVYSAPRVA